MRVLIYHRSLLPFAMQLQLQQLLLLLLLLLLTPPCVLWRVRLMSSSQFVLFASQQLCEDGLTEPQPTEHLRVRPAFPGGQ